MRAQLLYFHIQSILINTSNTFSHYTGILIVQKTILVVGTRPHPCLHGSPTHCHPRFEIWAVHLRCVEYASVIVLLIKVVILGGIVPEAKINAVPQDLSFYANFFSIPDATKYNIFAVPSYNSGE